MKKRLLNSKKKQNIEYVIQPQISKFLILRYKAVSVLSVKKIQK